MLLGEALALRADLKKRTGELKARIVANARYQDGETPGFDVNELLAEFDAKAEQLRDIIQRINRTNSAVPFDAGTLGDALIERDYLGLMHGLYQGLADASTASQHRHLKSELRSLAQVKASISQGNADGFAQRRRELDVRIQAANWTHELTA